MNRKEMLLAAGVGTLASCTKTATGLVVPSSRGGIAPASGSDPSGLFYQVKDWAFWFEPPVGKFAISAHMGASYKGVTVGGVTREFMVLYATTPNGIYHTQTISFVPPVPPGGWFKQKAQHYFKAWWWELTGNHGIDGQLVNINKKVVGTATFDEGSLTTHFTQLVGNNWLKWDHIYPKIGPNVISACDAALAVETGALVILLIDVVAAGRMPWDEAIQNQIVKDMTAVTAACIAVNAACDK